MTRRREAAAVVCAVLVAAAGLPLAAVTLPDHAGGTATAQTAPSAACDVVAGEASPEPGELVLLDASDTLDAEFVEFDSEGDGSFELADEDGDLTAEVTYSAGTYEPRVRAVNGDLNDTADCGTVVVAENEPPGADFEVATAPVVAGDLETLVAAAGDEDGEVVEYVWRVDGDVEGDSRQFEYEFPEPDEYVVNLTVTDDDGASTSVVRTIEALPSEPPEAALTANRSAIEAGDVVRFDASNSTDDEFVTGFEWDVDGDGTVDLETDEPAIVHRYASVPDDSWTPTVTVVDGDGLEDTASVTLRAANRPPVVDVDVAPELPAVGDPVEFAADASDPDGSVASYEWRIDGRVVAETSRFRFTFQEPGEYEVNLTATDDGGATTTEALSLTVDRLSRPPVAAIEANRTVLTGGGAVAFDAGNSTDPDGEIARYAWDFDGDGETDATGLRVRQRFALAANATTRRVRLTVTDDEETTDTATVLLSLPADRNEPPTAAFSQSPSVAVGFGANVTLNASASSDPDGSIASYAWDLDGDGSAEATGVTVTRIAGPVAPNATLTVTDDEGAAATVTKRINLFPRRRTGTFSLDDDTLVYVNEPPTAAFTVSPSKPEPGDEVTFESESFDADALAGSITIPNHTWYVNGTVEGEGTTLRIGDPGLISEGIDAGTYNVTLVVTDRGGATDRETKLVTVRDRQDDPSNVDFIFRGRGEGSPGKIVVGEPVEFRGDAQVEPGRSIDSLDWGFVPGAQGGLSGRSVVNSFTAPGEAFVFLTVTDSNGDSSRITRTIQVEPRDEVPKITDVDRDKRGATLQGAPISNTYTASVEAGDAVDRVEFELAGRTQTDRSGGNGWSAQFDLERLSDDATLTVTAVDSDGDSDTVTKRVEVVRTPGWVDWLIDTGSVSVERNPSRIVATRPIPDPPIEVRLDPPDAVPMIGKFSLFEWEIRGEGGIEFVMPARTADVRGDGLYRVALGGVAVEDRITGSGDLRITGNERWRLRNLRLSAGIRGCCWRPGVGTTVKFSEGPFTAKATLKASLKLGRGGSLTLELGHRNGQFVPTGGQIAISYLGGGTASASGQLLFKGRGIKGGVSAQVKKLRLFGAIDIETRPIRLRPSVRIELVVRAEATIPIFNEQIGKTFRFSGQIGQADIGHGTLSLRNLELESVGETTRRQLPARLGSPPAAGADAATTLGLDARQQALADAARLTEDDRRDGPPALAHGNGTYTAVWSRQDPDGAAGEFDLYAATADGGTWSEPVPIVDDDATAFDPDIAADGDLRAAIWTRAPAPGNDTTPAARLRNASLGFAVDDGSGWQSLGPIEDGNESSPVVAVADGTALLAWVRDPDGNVSTTADREVRWATFDGSAEDARTIPNATSVDVGGGPDGLTLTYLDSDDGENGSVVRADLVDGRLVTAARHSATGVTDLAAGPRSVAWTTFDNGTVLRHADGDGAATVPTRPVFGVDHLGLVEDAGQPVLVYGGQSLNGSATGLFAQRRTADGWLPPERLATAGDGNLSVTGVGTAAGEDGLAAAFGLDDASATGYADVFAVRQRFAPDLTITATSAAGAANASAGDRVRVDYTVSNVGSRATTTNTVVALEAGGGTVATRTHGPLAPGERANGSVTVEVGTGPTLRVDPGDAVSESDESNNARSVAVVRPDLAVGNVSQRGDGEEVVVEATVRNRGPVPVANATVALRSGTATLAGTRIDVPGSGARLVRLRIQRDAVNRSLSDAVVVDPGDAIDESDERNNAASLRLLAVDLALSESVVTTGAPGGVLAGTFVENAGPGRARALVTVAGDDAALTYGLRMPGPDGDGRTFERVRLYHPTTNGTLDLEVAPGQGVDAEGFDNVARAAVNASANDTAPVRVADATATNGTATLSVTLATDAGIATGVPVTARASGTTVAERTAVVPANDTRTVDLTAAVGDATSLTVAVPGDETTVSLAGAPDVNGNGAPATDPDGDGLYEDVTGDGSFDVVDVAVLLARFDDPVVRDAAGLFDFDGDGTVNVVDVAVLLEET